MISDIDQVFADYPIPPAPSGCVEGGEESTQAFASFVGAVERRRGALDARRDLIKERTLAGLAAARARGRTGGRPRLMTRAKLRAAMTMMADRNNIAGEVAEQLGISVSTLSTLAFQFHKRPPDPSGRP